jgi:hypothetical protein
MFGRVRNEKAEVGLTRRAAVGIIASVAATVVTMGTSNRANAAALPDRADLIDRCVQAGEDPKRVVTTVYDRSLADVRPCAVDGRWLVIVPGADLGIDVGAGDATVTAVLSVGPAAAVISSYRGITFTETERIGLAERSGEEKA